MLKRLMPIILGILSIEAFAKDKDGKTIVSEDQRATLVKFLGEKNTAQFFVLLQEDAEGKPPDAAAEAAFQASLTEYMTNAQTAIAENARLRAEALEHQRIIDTQVAAIETLSARPEADPQTQGIVKRDDKTPWVPSGKDTHLFGQNLPFMAIDGKHPYNMRAYSAMMAQQGVSYPVPMASSLDYESLKSDLGDYYRVRKQDRIQSFLMALPTIANTIFPLESGYQDQAVLVNMFMEEFTQADNTVGSEFANLIKGAIKFEAEKITMYDVMLVHMFTDLKSIEKNWLGYLNREGSSTMKWSFIEFVMAEVGKKIKNEQELRWLRGVRKNPTVNVPGTAMQASNGLLKFLKNQISLFKVKPFTGLPEPTSSTLANYIYQYTQRIPEVLRDSGRMVLYMSSSMLSDYHKNLESLYGLNQDYKPDLMFVKEYPSVKIQPIPNMGSSKRLIWTLAGNIILLEDQPGEMMRFNFEQKDWTLKVWSNWKESVWAYMTGKKFASAEEMPDDYSTQMIFCNDIDEPASYFIPMDADDATPSVLNHTSLVTVANAAPLAITDIDDAVVGQDIYIKWGNATNAPTIAAAGKFSLLSEAITDPEVGDVLHLKKRSDGKFIEIGRVFISSDAVVIADEDATPDVSGDNHKFVTSANTNPTEITNLENSEYGVIYTIYGGSDTNSSTIEDGGNFGLTDTMELSVGSWIKLEKSESDDILYEIERG